MGATEMLIIVLPLFSGNDQNKPGMFTGRIVIQIAMVIASDLPGNAQSQTGPLADFFGSEQRLE
jgi:hypothetical protein